MRPVRKHQERCKSPNWCVYCYLNLYGDGRFPGHQHMPAGLDIWGNWQLPLKRPTKSLTSSGASSGCLGECALSKKFPTLLEFISQSSWEDGGSRDLGTFGVSFSDGAVRVCLTDKDSGTFCFVSGGSLSDALAAAEKGLARGDLDFRQSSYGKPKKKG